MVASYENDRVMWLRILATCVQSGLYSLDHRLIAAPTPNYEGSEAVQRRWSLSCSFDVPQRILTMLGVDIFTDMRFDTVSFPFLTPS